MLIAGALSSTVVIQIKGANFINSEFRGGKKNFFLCNHGVKTLRKILIFGNSGSGKSTRAKELCKESKLTHLDLDSLAWAPVTPPERRPLEESRSEIVAFINSNPGWVIEGCYSDLLEMAFSYTTEMIFLDLPVELCIENARNRPWEPHKYESKEAQDSNLNMLVDWISQYSKRADTFSRASHMALYDKFEGKKSIVTSNE